MKSGWFGQVTIVVAVQDYHQHSDHSSSRLQTVSTKISREHSGLSSKSYNRDFCQQIAVCESPGANHEDQGEVEQL